MARHFGAYGVEYITPGYFQPLLDLFPSHVTRVIDQYSIPMVGKEECLVHIIVLRPLYFNKFLIVSQTQIAIQFGSELRCRYWFWNIQTHEIYLECQPEKYRDSSLLPSYLWLLPTERQFSINLPDVANLSVWLNLLLTLVNGWHWDCKTMARINCAIILTCTIVFLLLLLLSPACMLRKYDFQFLLRGPLEWVQWRTPAFEVASHIVCVCVSITSWWPVTAPLFTVQSKWLKWHVAGIASKLFHTSLMYTQVKSTGVHPLICAHSA